MAFSKDEVVLLKQARELEEMMNTPGWKTYVGIISEQLQVRQNLMVLPGSSLPESNGWDGMTRYGALEHVKGAYMGLRLALSTPQTIVNEAKELRDKASPNEGESK